jgi:hypothetical protein
MFKHTSNGGAYYSTVFLVRDNVDFKTILSQGCLEFNEWFGTVIANVESTRKLFLCCATWRLTGPNYVSRYVLKLYIY